jgi:hypothetical protein
MQEYRPGLTEAENQRVDELMKKLERIHQAEKEVATELRRLMYKIEASR